VSFTKAPGLRNINEVSPNLADIIDNLSHSHNELGIELTTNNFRIEYDDNIDYSTKKLIDNINKILDDKYGKLKKPEINTNQNSEIKVQATFPSMHPDDDVFTRILNETFETIEEANNWIQKREEEEFDPNFNDYFNTQYKVVHVKTGKQPTQTRKNTSSPQQVKNGMDLGKIDGLPDFIDKSITKEEYESKIISKTEKENGNYWKNIPSFQEHAVFAGKLYRYFDTEGECVFLD
jgi:hypothetical protein